MYELLRCSIETPIKCLQFKIDLFYCPSYLKVSAAFRYLRVVRVIAVICVKFIVLASCAPY